MTRPLRVSDFLNSDIITVKPDDEITSVVGLLVDKDISGVPVVDENGDLVGMLTERDCIRVALSSGYYGELGGLVREFMSSPVETVDASDNLMDVAKRFVDSTHRRFPVLDSGRLVGLLSRRDVLDALMSGSWFGKPPTSGRA